MARNGVLTVIAEGSQGGQARVSMTGGICADEEGDYAHRDTSGRTHGSRGRPRHGKLIRAVSFYKI